MVSVLKTLADGLRNRDVELVQGGQIPHLSVTLGGSYTANLVLASAVQSSVPGAGPDDVDVLQFFVPLRFTPTAHAELARLINHINVRAPLMGVLMNEEAGEVLLRYVHMFNPQEPNLPVIDMILTGLQAVIAEYLEPLHNVGTGKQTYAEAVAAMG